MLSGAVVSTVFLRVGLEPLLGLGADDGRDFRELPRDHAHGVDRVPERDGQGICAELCVALPRAVRGARQHTAVHHRHVDRQHLADVSVLDELAHVEVRGRCAPLQADHRAQVLPARERRHVLGLLRVRAERPLAVDMLARVESGLRESEVRRHAHGDERSLHLRVGAHLADVAIGALHAILVGRRLRGVRVRGAHGKKLGLRQLRQRRNVRPRAPASARPDQPHAQTIR